MLNLYTSFICDTYTIHCHIGLTLCPTCKCTAAVPNYPHKHTDRQYWHSCWYCLQPTLRPLTCPYFNERSALGSFIQWTCAPVKCERARTQSARAPKDQQSRCTRHVCVFVCMPEGRPSHWNTIYLCTNAHQSCAHAYVLSAVVAMRLN